jgi:hypothetical protein
MFVDREKAISITGVRCIAITFNLASLIAGVQRAIKPFLGESRTVDSHQTLKDGYSSDRKPILS